MGACGSTNIGVDETGRGGTGSSGSSVFSHAVHTGSPWDQYEPVPEEAEAEGSSPRRNRRPRSSDVLVQAFSVKDKDTGDARTARQVFMSAAVQHGGEARVREHLELILGLSHPNVAKVHRAYINDCSVHLIVDHIAQGVPLPEYLAQLESPSLGLLTALIRDMTAAVNYLHESGFAHTFLSPESFVVVPPSKAQAASGGGGDKGAVSPGGRAAAYAASAPTHPRVVLVDFGLEWKIGRNVGLFVAFSHAPYTSPEVATAITTLSLRNKATGEATRAADVFSVGALAYYVFAGRDLFQGNTTTVVLNDVKNRAVGPECFAEGTPGEYVPKAAADLIIAMTRRDPGARVSLADALASEFLKEDDDGHVDVDAGLLDRFRKYQQSTLMRKLLLATVNFRLESEHSGRIAAQFSEMDTDKSGRISQDEFRAAFRTLGASVSQLEQMFHSLDLDGSGELEYGEFLTSAQALGEVTMMDRMLRAFEMWDVDGNGYIDADDIRAACEGLYEEDEIQKIFAELEMTLEDGKICYAEFIKISQLPSTPSVGTSYNMKQSWTRIKNENPFKSYEQLNAPALGEGMTGKVYQIRNKLTGNVYAGKRVRVGRAAESKAQLMNEIHVMIDMDHPNIVRLHEVFESSSSLYLVMELCTGGELYDDLINREHYTERDAAVLFFQMVASIAYVHRRGIAHRDLKLENFIFQSKAENAPLKLIDFGLSKREGSGVHKMASVVGTAYYMAPEVVDRRSRYRVGKGKYYTKQCDMWSLGVLLYMMLCGQPPFDGRDNGEIMEAVTAGQYSTFEIRGASAMAQDLLSRLLELDPDRRLTAAEALKHPWFQIREQPGSLGNKPLTHIVSNIKKFNRMCRLKRACMSLLAFDMTDKDVETMRETFIKFDTDNSGSLSLAEFREAMAGMIPEADVEQVFKSVDFDSSGAIAYSEFLSATIHSSRVPKKDKLFPIFSRLDVDGNGTLEAADLKRICQDLYSEVELNRMVAAVDRNGDGKIGYEEFLEMMEATDDEK